MADAVSTQVIVNNARNYVAKFTNVSDGTGEAAVIKIAASATFTTHAKLWRVWYDVKTFSVRVQWNGTPNSDMLVLGGITGGYIDGQPWGGIWNNALTPTGAVSFTTIGAAANATYTIVMEFKLGV